MHYSAVKIRLSCNRSHVDAWANYLRARPDETAQSLAEELVCHEQWYLGDDADGLFLIGIMDVNAEDIAHAAAVTCASSLSINKIHQEFKQHWQSGEDLAVPVDRLPVFATCELLLDLKPRVN